MVEENNTKSDTQPTHPGTVISPTNPSGGIPQNSNEQPLSQQIADPPNTEQVGSTTVQPTIVSPAPPPNVFSPGQKLRKKRRVVEVIVIILVVLFVLLTCGYLLLTHNHAASKLATKQALKNTSLPTNNSSSNQSGSESSASYSSATDAAVGFITNLQANRKTEVDSMLSPSFKAQVKQETGTESYYDNCVTQCTARSIDLSSATKTSTAYKSNNGVDGETISFKSKSQKGGFNIVELSMIKVGNNYFVDAESDGGSTN